MNKFAEATSTFLGATGAYLANEIQECKRCWKSEDYPMLGKLRPIGTLWRLPGYAVLSPILGVLNYSSFKKYKENFWPEAQKEAVAEVPEVGTIIVQDGDPLTEEQVAHIKGRKEQMQAHVADTLNDPRTCAKIGLGLFGLGALLWGVMLTADDEG